MSYLGTKHGFTIHVSIHVLIHVLIHVPRRAETCQAMGKSPIILLTTHYDSGHHRHMFLTLGKHF